MGTSVNAQWARSCGKCFMIDPVWQLLEQTYKIVGNKPTLLERDFNIPSIDTLMLELTQIRKFQSGAADVKSDFVAA